MNDPDQCCMAALVAYYRANHVLPSYSRMTALFSVKSKSTVHAVVRRFKTDGYLHVNGDKRLTPTSVFLDLVRETVACEVVQ